MKRTKTFGQLVRYGIVGATGNLVGYSIYFFATKLGATPKLTMTVLYAAVVLIGFFANRRFTFGHKGHAGTAGVRYAIAQLMGYLLNLSLLLLFVDWLNFSHQIVQAVAVVVVAVFLFLLSRLFVFAPESNGPEQYDHETLS